MALFISYSSQDRSTVDALTAALRRGQNQVWFDQELGGGESWWNKILEQIRDCEVFIVALSNHWLQSKPSQAELRYAKALNRPILPVRIGDIDSMRVNPLAALQIIDYRDPTVDAGIQLVTGVHLLRSKPVPLPDPLPEEPPVPFGYITRLGNTLAEKELSPQQQTQLLVELRSGLDEDGDDPSARGDIAQLLRMLRLRHDVTYRTRTEIDNVLAEIEAKNSSSEGLSATSDAKAQAATAPTQPSTVPQPVSSPAASASTPVDTGGAASQKRLMIIGGAALVVVIAIVAVVLFMTQGTKSKPAPKATPNSAKLDSYLLGPADVGTIVNDPNMVAAEQTDQLRSPRGTLSNLDCLGAYEPIEDAVYKGAGGYLGVRGQVVHTVGEDPAHRVFESVVAFSSADKARAFVQASADKWKACTDKAVAMTTPSGKSTSWIFGNVAGAVPKIAQQRTETEGGTRTCHHVLHAVNDLVIDVLVCGADAAPGQAGRIAEQISTRVGQ